MSFRILRWWVALSDRINMYLHFTSLLHIQIVQIEGWNICWRETKACQIDFFTTQQNAGHQQPCHWPGRRLNIKTIFPMYGIPMLKVRRSRDRLVSYTWVYETSAGGLRSICLVHVGVRDKRRVSEIDLSQPRHDTAFWWRHNGPVTSQLTDPIKRPNYPLESIGIYVYINTSNKESLTQRCRWSTNVQTCFIF